MNICIYVNVENMWETPEKCGKLAKKCGKRVEMWKTCGKLVENSFVCTNVRFCRQLYKRESIFFIFLFFIFYFFSCAGT